VLAQQLIALVVACATLTGVHRTAAQVALERLLGAGSSTAAECTAGSHVAAALLRSAEYGRGACSNNVGGGDSACSVDTSASAKDPDDDGGETLDLWHFMIALDGRSSLEPPPSANSSDHSPAFPTAAGRPRFLSLCCFQC
jgi:hypothetical protein